MVAPGQKTSSGETGSVTDGRETQAARRVLVERRRLLQAVGQSPGIAISEAHAERYALNRRRRTVRRGDGTLSKIRGDAPPLSKLLNTQVLSTAKVPR